MKCRLQAPNKFRSQIDPTGGVGYDHNGVLAGQMVTQRQAVYAFRIHVELGLDALFLQCIQQVNGIFDRYTLIGLGMPNKGRRRIFVYKILLGMIVFFGFVILAQQIHKGTLMRIFTGGDNRVAQDLAVGAQHLGIAAQSFGNERTAPEIAVAGGKVTTGGETGHKDAVRVAAQGRTMLTHIAHSGSHFQQSGGEAAGLGGITNDHSVDAGCVVSHGNGLSLTITGHGIAAAGEQPQHFQREGNAQIETEQAENHSLIQVFLEQNYY